MQHISYRHADNNTDLRVDGMSLERFVRRMSIDHAAGDVPRVFLELKPGIDVDSIEVDGLVQIVRYESDPDLVADWLAHLDPTELEAEILDEFGAFSECTTGKAALTVLGRWAKGRTGGDDHRP